MDLNYRYLFVFLLITFASCISNPPEIKWSFTDQEVTGNRPKKENGIKLDVYVDATTSMQGFAKNSSSPYGQFLDQLETSALSAWKNADVKYYKFGESIRPIDRAEYLGAKSDPGFYHEKGIFMKTYIDSVVKRTDTARLSVLITDLFQDEGDVNTMVEEFKEKCFANGVEVGIAGIKSDYKGKVFDVPGFPKGYDLESAERPFYCIVFGNIYNMELLFQALEAKPFVKEDHVLIFSPHVIQSYNVTMNKGKVPGLGPASGTVAKNLYNFKMSSDLKEAKFDLAIELQRNIHCPDFSVGNVEFIAFKKSGVDPKNYSKDSVATEELTLDNLQRMGNKLTGVLRLKNEEGEGNYSYMAYLKTNALRGLKLPVWISEFSTDKPVPGTSSSSKTYNLEKLCTALLVANASVTPTYLSKFYINIFKR